jgi:hypothetical protein
MVTPRSFKLWQKTLANQENPTSQLKRGNKNAGWRNIGGHKIYFRSRWEANYARFLQYQKEKGWIKDWEHEPHTFWFNEIKRGVRSYLPDFRILKPQGTHYWVEVKGYMDPRSKTKLKRFKRYFPTEELILISSSWFLENNPKMRIIIKDWEHD